VWTDPSVALALRLSAYRAEESAADARRSPAERTNDQAVRADFRESTGEFQGSCRNLGSEFARSRRLLLFPGTP